MKVIVQWLGFHDDAIHESDEFETMQQVADFIEKRLGSPEDQTATLVDAATRENVSFREFIDNINKEE